jgi:hypothetical protein
VPVRCIRDSSGNEVGRVTEIPLTSKNARRANRSVGGSSKGIVVAESSSSAAGSITRVAQTEINSGRAMREEAAVRVLPFTCSHLEPVALPLPVIWWSLSCACGRLPRFVPHTHCRKPEAG